MAAAYCKWARRASGSRTGGFNPGEPGRCAYTASVAKKLEYRTKTIDAQKAEALRRTLISWFRENGRDLPWRRTRDPWRILVSEVMLQQIQVARAVPFYESFVALFPTPRALAEAPLSE